MDVDDVTITELLEIDPSRVDAVGNPANGTDWLMLKSIDGEVSETVVDAGDVVDAINAIKDDVIDAITKADDAADDDATDCATCKGSGKIMEGHRECPKCKGSGNKPKIGDSAKATAPSGAPVPVRHDCPTCNGAGTLPPTSGLGANPDTECPDCNGTGRDGTRPPGDKLNAVQGFNGNIDHGDPKGRETIDKAEMSGKDTNDLPDSAFAHIESGGKKDSDGKTTPRSLRHFPIHDAAHVRNALARAGQSPFGDKAMPAIKAAAKKFGVEVGKSVEDDGVDDGGIVSGPNPFTSAAGANTDTSPAPGTPEWEATDAAIATQAAQALMQASELISQFAGREAIEVAAGEGNDLFDTYDAYNALDAVTAALGIIARLAFHEGMAAQKAEGVAEKAGKRLSVKSVSALAAARDHLTALLGDDDPANASDDDEGDTTSKSLSREIDDMTLDELLKALDERDEARRAAAEEEVEKGKDTAADTAKDAKKGKSKPVKDDDTTDADATAVTADDDASDDDAAKSADDDAVEVDVEAAKAADDDTQTPEQIEARKQVKDAKKALKAARRTEEAAAEQVAIAKALKEEVEKDREAITALQQRTEERLAQVEKMAAPGGPSKTRTPDMVNKAAERDALDLEIAKLERLARETPEAELRRGYTQAAKELRVRMTEASPKV